MEGEQQAVYENYSKFKEIKGIQFSYPFEIAEDVMNAIIEYVTGQTKTTQINGQFCKNLRETLDRKFGPAWHVFVGKNFGCYAIHDVNCFTNFKYKGFTYLIYKTTI